jgi:hypothetical protein
METGIRVNHPTRDELTDVWYAMDASKDTFEEYGESDLWQSMMDRLDRLTEGEELF